ncbi:MAG: hypothetical protein AAFY33_08045 [Cyanobacteria bacterium J06643_4]
MTHFSPMRSLSDIAADAASQQPFDASVESIEQSFEQPPSQPIGIILSSSGEDQTLPGETLEISVTVTNKGNQSAIIDVFLDELPAIIQSWCHVTQTRLALDPGQGEEVVFSFDIPENALSGAYRYWLVVDAPHHYPDSPPQRHEQTLQVLPSTETAVRVSDPTFAIEPITTLEKPAKTLPGNPLQFQIYVYNRADRVDRFRLICNDLPEEWVSVHYPQGFQAPGLAIVEPHLDLNPGMDGVILLTVTPPPEALAETLLATLQLKSENNPELSLLEILHLNVQPVYQLDTRFRTLVSRIQRQPGLFSIQAHNQGNTPRAIEFDILGNQDKALCDYRIEPALLTLAPQQSLTSEITVRPKHFWKRPLFGGGRMINFEVTATDPEQKPFPEMPMHGMVMWEARPWWQILPAMLLVLGSFLGLIWLVWWFFIRPPSPANVLRFAPEDTVYDASRGDTAHLGFEIEHYQRIQRIEIVGVSAEGELLSGPIVFDLRKGLPPKLTEACVEQRYRLVCRNVRTDARRSGDYLFTMTLIPKPGRNARQIEVTTLPVAIAPAPLPKILEFGPTATQYVEAAPTDSALDSPSEKNFQQDWEDSHVARLNWRIEHPEQLQALRLIRNNEAGPVGEPIVFEIKAGELPDALASYCLLTAELVCNHVPTGVRQSGTYTFELVAIPTGERAEEEILASSEAVTVQARSPQLLSFTLNGQPVAPSYLIPVNAAMGPVTLELAWEAENNPGTQVMMSPAPGDVPIKGTLPIQLSPEPGETLLALQVTNAIGEQITRSVTITTYNPTPETPTIVVNTGDEAGATVDAGGGNAAGGGSGAAGNRVGAPVPIRPGTVSPRELPPQFE